MIPLWLKTKETFGFCHQLLLELSEGRKRRSTISG